MFFQLEKNQSIDFRKQLNIEASTEGILLLQKGFRGIKTGWCIFQNTSDGYGGSLYLIGAIDISEESYYLTKATNGIKAISVEYSYEMAKKYCRNGSIKTEMQHLNLR